MKWRLADTFWLVVMMGLLAVGTCVLPGCGDLLLQEDALVADPVGTAQAKEIIMTSYGRPGAHPAVFWYGLKALSPDCGDHGFLAPTGSFLSVGLGPGLCNVGLTSNDRGESVVLAPGVGWSFGFATMAHELAHQAYGKRADNHPSDIFGPGGSVEEATDKVRGAGLMP